MARRRTRTCGTRSRTYHAAGARRGAEARGRLTTAAELALYAALFVAVFAFAGAVTGFHSQRVHLVRAAALALPWLFALTSIALAGLALALVSADLSLRYVAEEVTLNMPRAYKAAAIWTGPAGRWLLFAWLVTGCAALARRARAHTARSTLLLAAAAMLALLWAALPTPFERLAFIPLEGMGRAAALQLPQLLAVTPVLLLGYALVIVAVALSLDSDQRGPAARWLLPAWLCMTLGLSLGAWTLERFVLPGWPPRAQAVVSLLVWLIVATALLLPRNRAHWWPRNAVLRRVFLIGGGGGVLLALAGGVGRLFSSSHELSLGSGASTTVRDVVNREWTLAQQGVSPFRTGDTEVLAVTLEGVRGAQRVLLVSERRQFVDSRSEEVEAPLVRVGHAGGALQDLTLTLLRVLPNDLVQLRVGFTPLGVWLWVGLGSLLAASTVAWAAALQHRN